MQANIEAALPPAQDAAASNPLLVPVPPGGPGGTDADMADASPFLSPLSKEESPNKTRKGEEGQALPEAPGNLSEEQKQQQEQQDEEQAKLQAKKRQQQVDAQLAEMLEQARKDRDDKEAENDL